jgi:AhpD family alkylhydroperoxidase
MSRISPVTGTRAPLLLRLMNAAARRMVGQAPEPLQLVAHNRSYLLPTIFMSRMGSAKTKLDSETRTLAAHLVAELNDCTWCIDLGNYMAQREGIPGDKLASVMDHATSPLFSPAEKVALAYAEAVTAPGSRVSDELFGQLREHYSEQEIVELTVAVAFQNYANRFNIPLGIESQHFATATLEAQPA